MHISIAFYGKVINVVRHESTMINLKFSHMFDN